MCALTRLIQGFVDRFRAGAQVAMLNLPGLDIDIDGEIELYKLGCTLPNFIRDFFQNYPHFCTKTKSELSLDP